MALDSESLREGWVRVGGGAGGKWLLSPEPMRLDLAVVERLERLGHPLRMFEAAGEQVYRRSVNGTLPGWIAELLDAGKPAWMVEQQRSAAMRDVVPRVMRPDVLLGRNGMALTGLDLVPEGLGLAGWLAETYAAEGFPVLGGARGVVDGFRRVSGGGGRILVSEQAGGDRAEMEWLASALNAGRNGDWAVCAAEEDAGAAGAVYCHFDWCDWEVIPAVRRLAGHPDVTPPCKPLFDGPLWLALLWSPALMDVWREQLRGSHLKRMRDLVPYAWVVDPTPLPPHASLPRLHVNSWQQVAGFRREMRRLVLKAAGSHGRAGGRRAVVVGHEVRGSEWAAALEQACREFDGRPWIVQEFSEAAVVEHPYFDPGSGEVKVMRGQVRLRPYYFVDGSGSTGLGGCVAVITPADRKPHGAQAAIMVPCVAGKR